MRKILLIQSAALLVVVAISAAWGRQAAVSALLGGLCYLLPNALAVLILNILKPYPQYAAKGWLAGEGLKIALSVVLMLSVFVFWQHQLKFIPFFVGLLIVSQAVFLAILRVQRYGK